MNIDKQIERRLLNLNIYETLKYDEFNEEEIGYDIVIGHISNRSCRVLLFTMEESLVELMVRHYSEAYKEGMKPLHLFALNYEGDFKSIEIIMFIKLLVDWGDNIDELDEYGNSPLHYACTTSAQLVLCFLKCGSKSLYTNKEGHTPLHFAIKSEEASSVKLIITWFPELLVDPTIKECCIEEIKSGESTIQDYLEYLLDLHRFILRLFQLGSSQFSRICTLMEIAQPYTLISCNGTLSGKELALYAYKTGNEVCDLCKVPL